MQNSLIYFLAHTLRWERGGGFSIVDCSWVLLSRWHDNILFPSIPDFNRREVLVSTIVTKMFKPFHWHLKLLKDKTWFWLFNGIDVFRRRPSRAQCAAVPCRSVEHSNFRRKSLRFLGLDLLFKELFWSNYWIQIWNWKY